jgi:3-hydroxy-9,10-secoandrosta-1,3,5(10)-triene-9,17-dione monooxygenase reductase component
MSFRDAMALLPTGVTIVSAPSSGGPAGATANAVTSLSLDPPLMLACLDRGSRTLDAVREAGRFGISVLRSDDAGLARSFSGPFTHAERWAEVGWRELDGVPMLDDALLRITCVLGEVHEGGDHVILTGAVIGLDRDGDAADPLIFHRGVYRGLHDNGGH